MGVLSALIVGPCVAAPLIGVLSYISMSGDLVLGGITLFVMGLGMGFPLLIIGTSAGRLLPKAGAWMNTIKAAFGVGLLAVAIWMLERVLAPAVTMSLWAALALTVAVFLRVGRPIERRVFPMLGKALGHALTVYGVMILVGVASGSTDPLRPLQALTQQMTNAAGATHPVFQPVASSNALDQIIAVSAQTGKPVMLDFYADWCVSCKEMEKYTFADPAFAALMSEFTLVQADVTNNNADDKALLERFDLFTRPPFFSFNPMEASLLPFASWAT
jgi:thiol:disulfide interchange protein DsbD